MQPLSHRTSCVVARTFTPNCRVIGRIPGIGSQSHQELIPLRRYASSKASDPGRNSAPKPLPYKPGPSKGQLHNKRTQQQHHEEAAKNSQNQSGTWNRKAPIADLVRDRWFAILGYGSALVCLGYFTSSVIIYWRREPAPCYPLGCEPDVPTGRPSIQSPYEFDLHLDKSEWRYGITKLRRELGTGARGHVLEVAVGTGRNMEFYNWDAVTDSLLTPEQRAEAEAKSSSWMSRLRAREGEGKGKGEGKSEGEVLSFTGIDISPGMLDIALRRIRQTVPHMEDQIPKKPSFAMLAAAAHKAAGERPEGSHVVSFISDRIRLLQADAQFVLPPPPPSPSSKTSPPPEKYDTILQTFGLCSVHDPVSLLELMASSVQPGTGRILLLEHGRSIWEIVNGLLDRGARGHHTRFGCWWNRDIEAVVREAARRIPNLEILRLDRPGWTTGGTHFLVELRLRDPVAEAKKNSSQQAGGPEKKKGWPALFDSILTPTPKKNDENEEK